MLVRATCAHCRTSTFLPPTWEAVQFVDDDRSLVNRVWKLDTNAAAIDAAIFYRTGDGALAMVCMQNKFSARDASTLLGWRERSTFQWE